MAYDNGVFKMSIKDYSNNNTGFKVNTEIPAAGGTVMADLIAARDAFIDAVEGVIDGRIISGNLILNKVFGAGASDVVHSQAEYKLTVYMRDNVTEEPYHFTIPTYKAFTATFAPKENSDEMDLNLADLAALVTACNAFCRSPEAGHDGTVYKIVRSS